MGTWRPVGLGARAVADPWTGLLAALAAPLGDPALAQRLLLAAGVPLAGLAAWGAAAVLTRSGALRWWAALAWAAAPPLLAAVLAGRPAAVAAHVLLPVAALALVRCRTAGARPVASAARLGLVLTALLAAAPSLTVPALLVLAGAAVVPVRPPPDDRSDLARGPRWSPLVAAAVPAALLLPWWVAVARTPHLLLAAADGTLPGAPPGAQGQSAPAGGGAPWWHLLGLPAAPDADLLGARLAAALPALPGGAALAVVAGAAVAVPLAVCAVAGPLRRRAGGAALLGWWAAGLGLALAAVQAGLAVGRWPVSTDGTGPGGPATTGPALSLALAGLAVAALLGAQVVPVAVARRIARPRLTRTVLAAAATVALAAPALALAGAAAAGTGAAPPARRPARGGGRRGGRAQRHQDPRPAHRPVAGPAALGAAARQRERAGGRVRRPRRVARAPGPALAPGPGRRRGASGARAAAVRGWARQPRRAGDAGGGLDRRAAAHRPRHRPRPRRRAGTDPPARRRHGAAVAGGPAGRVRDIAPGAARVVDAATGALQALPSRGAEVRARLDPGPAGRRIVLAERHDAGWQATLDGVPLAPARSGWAQAFVLPARGGQLEVTHDDGVLAAADPGRAGALALALLLALPMPRLRGRVGPPPPPRPSRPVARPTAAPHDLQPAMPPQVFDADHLEGEIRPLYVGPPPRGLRRLRRASRAGRLARRARLAALAAARAARRLPPGGQGRTPPGGQP
jgi:hypothetical protein